MKVKLHKMIGMLLLDSSILTLIVWQRRSHTRRGRRNCSIKAWKSRLGLDT